MVYSFYVAGGVLSLVQLTGDYARFLDPGELQNVGSQIRAIPKDSTVLCRPDACRVALYFGLQIVFGTPEVVWAGGGSVLPGLAAIRAVERDAGKLREVLDNFSARFVLDSLLDPLVPKDCAFLAATPQQSFATSGSATFRLYEVRE
jgi:hypothetical protein